MKINGIKDFDKFLTKRDGDELIRERSNNADIGVSINQPSEINPSGIGEILGGLGKNTNGEI